MVLSNSLSRFFLLLLFCTITTSLYAQDVSGVYHVRGNSPEGGTNYVLFPDNTFVVGYFGGMITGTWKKEGNQIFFKNRVTPKFVLYGRSLPRPNDTVSVRFNVRENQGVAVGFTKQEPLQIQYVFNANANCFSYPYIHKQTEEIFDFYVATIPYNSSSDDNVNETFHFENKERFNDFIMINLPNEYTSNINFSARIEKDLLYFDSNVNGSTKNSLESMSKEDAVYLKDFTENALLPTTLHYGNEFFPYLENPTEPDLIPFKRLEAIILNPLKVSVLKNSIFYTVCED